MTSLDTQNYKVFYVQGSLKDKGYIEADIPYDDLAFNSWQVSLSYLSVYNKEASTVNKLLLISTNFVKDYKTDKFSEKEIWNPPIVHVNLSLAGSTSNCFPVNQNFFNITNYSPKIIFFFKDAVADKSFVYNVNVFLTVLFKKQS